MYFGCSCEKARTSSFEMPGVGMFTSAVTENLESSTALKEEWEGVYNQRGDIPSTCNVHRILIQPYEGTGAADE